MYMIANANSILLLTNDFNIDSSIGFMLERLNYPYVVFNRDYMEAMKLLSTGQIKCILLPLWDNELFELGQAIEQAYCMPYVFYTPYFTLQTRSQIKEMPPPIYLARTYNKDELYVNIELACYNYTANKPI